MNPQISINLTLKNQIENKKYFMIEDQNKIEKKD
jgi:hypothetical protein